jgi:hypothetical protein
MKRQIKIFVLCVLPIALGFFIRHRYVNSPEYAVNSFMRALRNSDENQLKHWSTLHGWADVANWTREERYLLGNMDPAQHPRLQLTERQIHGKSFVIASRGSHLGFVFFHADSGWKMIGYLANFDGLPLSNETLSRLQSKRIDE